MGYAIRSLEWFYIGATKSTAVGLNVEFLQPPAMAAQQYTQWNTGKDMADSSADNYFETIQYTISARVLRNPSGFASTDIYALFANAKTLTLSCCPEYYYKIRRVVSILPSANQRYKGNEITYEITLELAPFKYHISNSSEEVTQGTITNPGTRYSRPVYVISGLTSGTTAVTLTVNGQQFKLTGLTTSDGIITIDAEKLLCYWKANAASTSTVNLMPKSEGQIPFLNTGINTAYVSDGTLTITGNWRSY